MESAQNLHERLDIDVTGCKMHLARIGMRGWRKAAICDYVTLMLLISR